MRAAVKQNPHVLVRDVPWRPPSMSAVSALALSVTIQVSRYCKNSFPLLAGQLWLGNFGWTNVVAPVSKSVVGIL